MGKPAEEKSEFRSRDRWLLVALLTGPIAVLTHLTLSYSLVPTSCANGTKTVLHLSSAFFLALILGAALMARQIDQRCARENGALWIERTRWLARGAFVLAISSAVVIVAMEIPNLILRSCD
jgi:hypothetical protein